MKVAIVFKGGISKKIGNLLNPNEINTNSEFINYHCAYNSFKKHIIDANPKHEIDTFIHCWHPELEEEFRAFSLGRRAYFLYHIVRNYNFIHLVRRLNIGYTSG
jgi:hypothetical protein